MEVVMLPLKLFIYVLAFFLLMSGSFVASAKDLLSDEELAKKMSDYYKGASDQEIDEFIIGQTNAKKSTLPQKINKSITLYKVEYLKDKNIVAYGYEVNADNLGLTEKELVAIKQTVTHNLREHHISYFCTFPSIRMELDIGIDFFINIISEKSHYLGSYQISKGDCIKGLTQRTNVPPQGAVKKLSDFPEKATREQNQVNPTAIQEAGLAFATGDYPKAIALFMPLAKQGNPLAQGSLGMMHYNGHGVSQNYKEAIKWTRKAAEQGETSSQLILGMMYDSGKGVPLDKKVAVKWYRKAAEQGYSEAQFNLGKMYYEGKGVQQDHKEAAKWHRKAAEQGHSVAQNNIGMMYNFGRGVPQDFKEAMKWYRKDAKKGGTSSQNNIGVLYKKGQGVLQDYKEAVKWFHKAAEQGHPSAQSNLADMYISGTGVPQDVKKAMRLYHKATELGGPSSQNVLGLIYYKGESVLQDKIKAHMWFNVSASLGNKDAKTNMAILEKQMTSQNISIAKELTHRCVQQKYKNCEQLKPLRPN
jgi:uncharacterized protein